MQETHEDEIKILNEIDKLAIQYSMDKKNEAKLKATRSKDRRILRTCQRHFANEERLMKKYDFPSYEMHKMAHDMFLMDIGISIKQWKKFGDVQ